ncbi:MAG: hypothetical protein KC496_11735 [Anaerolineae bacterium]|nr:hypothetical protein [Anaerolineae bacterium]
MKKIHRWLMVPALLILVSALLVLFGFITFETGFPLENTALAAAVIAGAVLLIALGIEGRSVLQSWEMPEPEDPPSADYVIQPKPLDDAMDSVEEAEQFSKRATERILIDLDIEDSRDDR